MPDTAASHRPHRFWSGSRPRPETRGEWRRRRVSRGLAIGLASLHLSLAAAILLGPLLVPPARERLASVAPISRSAARPAIVDRADRLLAADTRSVTLHVLPDAAAYADSTARAIAGALGSVAPDSAILARRIATAVSGRLVLLEGLSLRAAERIRALGLRGVLLEVVHARQYPSGPLAAELVGAVDAANRGVRGIEATLDRTGRSGSAEPVRLTLDIGAVHVLGAGLEAARRSSGATMALGLTIDVRDGRLLAAAVRTAANAHGIAARSPSTDGEHERFGGTLFEPGALLAPVLAALALEQGQTLATRSTITGPLIAGPIVIEERGRRSVAISLFQIARGGSRIGAARIALGAGSDRLQAHLDRMGLLGPLQWEAGPIPEPRWPSRSEDAESAEIATGRLLLVSPVQLTAALAALANGGRRHSPWLVEEMVEPAGREAMLALPPGIARRLRRVLGIGPLFGSGVLVAADRRGEQGDLRHRSVFALFPPGAPRWATLLVLGGDHFARPGMERVTRASLDRATRRLSARLPPILAGEHGPTSPTALRR